MTDQRGYALDNRKTCEEEAVENGVKSAFVTYLTEKLPYLLSETQLQNLFNSIMQRAFRGELEQH